MEKQVFHIIKIVINCPEHDKIQMFRAVPPLMYLFSEACLSIKCKIITVMSTSIKNIATENVLQGTVTGTLHEGKIVIYSFPPSDCLVPVTPDISKKNMS